MRKSFNRRLTAANTMVADAIGRFEKAAEDLEEASRVSRQTYDEIQDYIENLTSQAAAAEATGRRADEVAKRLRKLVS